VKLLVIGRSGQVAQALGALDGEAGHQVITLGRPEVDLVVPETVHAAIKAQQPDVVINAGAYTAVDQAETERDAAFAINDHGAGGVAEACTRFGVPLIHISTDYVFDGTKPTPYSERDPVAPLGVYGQSKCAGEQRVRTLCPHHIILRTAWVFSPFGKNFVKTMLSLAETRDEISVVSDQVGSPTYAPHLAQAIVDVCTQIHGEREDVVWGTYHAAGGGEASWFEVAQKTFATSRALGGVTAKVSPIPSSDYPTPAKRPANSRLDCANLQQNFNTTIANWEHGVEACVRQLSAH